MLYVVCNWFISIVHLRCKDKSFVHIFKINIHKSGSNIEYNPKFLSKIKKALEFQCLYRSFYFHWLKQS